MTFKLTDLKKDIYQTDIDESVTFFGDFFEIKLQPRPCLILVDSHKQFEQIISKPIPNWLTGYNVYNLVFVLHPDKWQTESNHQYSPDKFKATLKHEICHIYFKKITGSSQPIWLNEGLALYLSGQLKFRKDPGKLDNFLQFSTDNTIGNQTVYDQSGFAVQTLHQKYGKQNLLKLIKSIKTLKSPSKFSTLFQKIYKIPLTYQTFNSQ